MIIEASIPSVFTILTTAARSRKTVSFKALFSCFPTAIAPSDVWDTLEAAEVQIADRTKAIYSALMAKHDSGFPGDGFFDTFRMCRPDDYGRVAGKAKTLDLSHDQKREIVDLERATVFRHAALV